MKLLCQTWWKSIISCDLKSSKLYELSIKNWKQLFWHPCPFRGLRFVNDFDGQMNSSFFFKSFANKMGISSCLIWQTRALILFMLEPNSKNNFFSLTQLIELYFFNLVFNQFMASSSFNVKQKYRPTTVLRIRATKVWTLILTASCLLKLFVPDSN